MLFPCCFAKIHALVHAAAPFISILLRCPYFIINFFQMDICSIMITTPSKLRLFCKLRNKISTFPKERRFFFIILFLPCIYLLNGSFDDTFRFCCICCGLDRIHGLLLLDSLSQPFNFFALPLDYFMRFLHVL